MSKVVKITIELPDDLALKIAQDAVGQNQSISDYILCGLAAGIGDGLPGYHCGDMLDDYLRDRW